MTKFLFKFNQKRLYFWPIAPILGAKKTFFSQKLWLCHAQLHLEPCQNSEKSNDPIPRKHPDRWHNRRTNRSYFTGSFQLLPGVWQVQLQLIGILKSQRYIAQYWSNQKLLHHNQHAKNQLNSYSHS